MRRGAFRAAAGLARLRVGRRPAAGHTLVVRSTSYGDFVNLLPFLSVLEAERGPGAVDLLLLSRVGPVGNSFLPAFKGRIVTLEVNAGAVSIAGIGRARRLVGARAWEVLYLGQSTEEPWARLKKLVLVRGVVGLSPPVFGFAALPWVCTRTEAEADVGRGILHQALAPFANTGQPVGGSRSAVMDFLDFSLAERRRAEDLSGRLRSGASSVVGLYVHSRAARKLWPADRFLAVARALLEMDGLRIVFVGGEEDLEPSRRLAAALRGADRVAVVCGETSLRESILVLGGLDLLIGNDGAPVHLAALGGAPVVSVFCAWEPPGIWEPILAPASRSVRPAWELRRPPDRFAIEAIPASAVVEAARSLMAGDGGHTVVTVAGAGGSTSAPVSGFPFTEAASLSTAGARG